MRFFWNYANYALIAELCDFASVHNSGSPVCNAIIGRLEALVLTGNDLSPVEDLFFLAWKWISFLRCYFYVAFQNGLSTDNYWKALIDWG